MKMDNLQVSQGLGENKQAAIAGHKDHREDARTFSEKAKPRMSPTEIT